MHYKISDLTRIPTNSKMAILLLASMCICLVGFADERGINQILITIMAFSPIMLITAKKVFYIDVIGFILFWILIYIFSSFTPNSFRSSTLIYSGLFISTYLAFFNYLRRGFLPIRLYITIIRVFIFLFTLFLVLQQICVLLGLPIPNDAQQIAVSKWKLNTLTLEPSHAARLMFIFMYSYILCVGKMIGQTYSLKMRWRKDKLVWIAFFWTMITMISSTAVILLVILLVKATFIQAKSFVNLLVGSVLFGVIFFFFIPESLIDRPLRVIEAVFSLDPDAVVGADDSASFRIVPAMIILDNVDLFDSDIWVGHGVDYDQVLLYQKMGERLGEKGGGGILTVMLNYGMISFLLFLLLIFKTSFSLKDPFGILIWILFFSLGGLNTQVFWAIQMFYTANKFFLEKTRRKIPARRLYRYKKHDYANI